MEFPFNAVYQKLRSQLPDKRKVGTYKRMASFNFRDYKDSEELKIIYLNKHAIEKNKKYFNKIFYNFLKSQND